MNKKYKNISNYIDGEVTKHANKKVKVINNHINFNSKYESEGKNLLLKRIIILTLIIIIFNCTIGGFIVSLANLEDNEKINIEEIKKTVETSANVDENQEPKLDSRIALVYDRNSGNVLYEKNGYKTSKMASTTKIMTCIVTLENANLNDVVVVDKKAAATGGSRLGLKTGDKITVNDLLYGLMFVSGNDVAVKKEKLNNAEENYKHFAIMYKDGVIPQEEYDRSLNQLTKAQDDYEKAVEASDSGNTKKKTFVKKNVSTSKVYAPKDGVVSLSYLNKGETAVKDKPVVLLDSNRPKVTAYFNPKHAGDLKVGKEVNIRIKNYGSKKFTGVIDAVGTEPEMDARNKSLVIPVQISFKDDLNGYTIEKGQPVQVRFKK